MSTRKELKARAKESLKGNYGKLILALIVTVLIGMAIIYIGEILIGIGTATGSFLTGFCGAIIFIVGMIATFYLTIGYSKMLLKVARNQETSLNELFSKDNFPSTFRIVGISIVESIIVFFASYLIIPAFILPLSYAFVVYMAIDEGTGLNTIKNCRMMMKGHKWDLFVLELSFIGWIILSILTLGILSLWVAPYIAITEINFYDEVKANRNTVA